MTSSSPEPQRKAPGKIEGKTEVRGALACGCATVPENAGLREITVRGVAEVVVPPDFVTVSTRVVTLDKDVRKAQAENDQRVKAVLALVEKLGVEPRDLRTGYVSLRTKERREENKPPVFEGYEAVKNITVVLRDMTKYDELISAMLEAGVNRISSVSFGSSDEIEKRREARLLAIKAAREKAEYLAGQLGQRVGKPLWIAEYRKETPMWGSFATNAAYFYRPEREAKADQKRGTIAPGSSTIRAQVEVSFELAD